MNKEEALQKKIWELAEKSADWHVDDCTCDIDPQGCWLDQNDKMKYMIAYKHGYNASLNELKSELTKMPWTEEEVSKAILHHWDDEYQRGFERGINFSEQKIKEQK
jgi:hypothetical protein